MTTPTRRYFLQIAYRGTHYHGWQVQQNATTVQGTIQAGLALLLRREVPIVGSSRTDTGVHARQQFAHVDLDASVDVDRLHYQLNAVLPPDIAVEAMRSVEPGAHARFDAIARTYQYTIVRTKAPFLRETSYWLRTELDLHRMNEAAAILCQRQNFRSLCKERPTDEHFLCDVMEAHWLMKKDQWIFRIKANRFLRSMVRITVALLLRVGQGTMSLAALEELLDQQKRDPAVGLVPAWGLTLTEVTYPRQVWD